LTRLKFCLFFCTWHFFISNSTAQNCTWTFEAKVIEKADQENLAEVSIYIEELGIKGKTDTEGRFKFSQLCQGRFHVNFSHVACQSKRYFVDLSKPNLEKVFYLDHSVESLHDLEVTASSSMLKKHSTHSVSRSTIQDRAGENLAQISTVINGVQVLKNGSGIAKPLINGFLGNRVSILNNGVALAGQQWGNDHSPELDPSSAQNIKIIKGAQSLAYPASNAGAVLLVEPGPIENEPHPHAHLGLFTESNGRGLGINTRIEQSLKHFSFRTSLNLKKVGDKNSPDYYLKNTGLEEASWSIQLEKQKQNKWESQFYLSHFATQLGILRGSQIGNLSDLNLAYSRNEPFYTESQHSYDLNAPKQKVQHWLFKAHYQYFKNLNTSLEFNLAYQLNSRKEFDIRRSRRSEIPSLFLKQYNFYGEAKWHHDTKKQTHLEAGTQAKITDNTNQPETGILPLIPDFRSYEASVFGLGKKEFKAWGIDWATRLDALQQTALPFSQTLPRTVLRFKDEFLNLSASLGLYYHYWGLNHYISLNRNGRNPAINERFSQGLHQGVSGIEEGAKDLKSEQIHKINYSISFEKNHKISLDADFYFNYINQYIYLSPSLENRLTIRGAFPVFKYQQTDASMLGFDGKLNVFLKKWEIETRLNLLKTQDLRTKMALVYIPSNRLKQSLRLHFSYKNWGQMSWDNQVEVVDKIRNTDLSLDFLAPPPAYFLLSTQFSLEPYFFHKKHRILLKVENLLNQKYRDYLNRLRYFAEEEGRNISLNWQIKI
jgi:iron complex outermembrane recepter protein